MPLLGARLHVLNPIWKRKKVQDNEQHPGEADAKPEFLVQQTLELCSSTEEVQQKTTIYAGHIWTCRVTGKNNMTYRDAAKSEGTSQRILKKNFPKFFERPIIELVHTSTLPLDALVHLCSISLQEQFHVSEPVKLKVDSVSSNPRVNRVPSKEHIRMFIRAHAMRYGPNFSGPWIVDAEMLRRYKIPSKSAGFEVDKVKLKQMSNAVEVEYLARILKSKTSAANGATPSGITLNGMGLAQSLALSKRAKRFSVLRDENAAPPTEDDTPLSAFTKKSMKKRMKQFGGNSKQDASGAAAPSPTSKVMTATPKKSSFSFPVLPRVGQHLVKVYTENPEDPMLANCITMCAKLLTDAQLTRLPKELREKVVARKGVLDYRRKLKNMTPLERKDFIRERREQERIDRVSANQLMDDQELATTSKLPCLPLPPTSGVYLPESLSPHLFGRLLGLAEFLHCFQTLLIEGLDYIDHDSHTDNAAPSTSFPITPIDSAVPGLGDSGFDDDDDVLNSDDEEEEMALICATAPLPKPSAASLRRLGLQRLMRAVSTQYPSAGSYRSLALPLCLLLRLLLRDEELAKKRELGLRLAKLPVTPYTAPELLRLTLLHGSHDSNKSQTDETEVMTTTTTTSVLDQLTKFDIYQLEPEQRLHLLETAVEQLFDLDLIDDYILVCQRKAYQYWQRKHKFNRDRNTRKKELKDEKKSVVVKDKKPEPNSTPVGQEAKLEPDAGVNGIADVEGNEVADDDLASIVKRRRVLAARAAVEREERDALDRERRIVLAQESAQERTFSMISRAYDVRAAEASCALRCQPLGLDRNHRRIWFFRCAPDRLYVESNWASPYVNYTVSVPMTDEETKQESEKKNITKTDEETTIPTPATLVKSEPSEVTDDPIPSCWSTWTVYDRPEQLDALANALLERGIRESRLKSQLLTNGLLQSIKSHWLKAKPTAGTAEVDTPENTPLSLIQSSNRQTINKQTSEKSTRDAEACLANALLKSILDIEVRLRSGGLGGVPDFAKWQEQLAELHSSFGLPPELTPNKDNKKKKHSNAVPANTIAVTPTIKVQSNPPGKPDRAGLAKALLEIAENVMPRFLNVPDLLSGKSKEQEGGTQNNETVKSGTNTDDAKPETANSSHEGEEEEDDDDSDQSSSDSDESCDSLDASAPMENVLKNPDQHAAKAQAWLTCWRAEVRNSQTLARLNLLHACLDACIRWERSVEDARCRICRQKSDDDNLLLCDGCNHAFHLYCLRPPLRRVPASDWFCVSCLPASRDVERRRREARAARSERRRVRHNECSSAEEEEESAKDASDSECDAGPEKRSRQSAGKRKPDLSAYRNEKVSNRTSIDRVKPTLKHDAACLICENAEMDLIECSGCPNSLHLSCHNPPLRHQPRGDAWLCTHCRVSGRKAFTQTSSRSMPSRVRRRAQFHDACRRTKIATTDSPLRGEDEPTTNRPSRSSSRRVTADDSETATRTSLRPFRRPAPTPLTSSASRPSKRRRLDSSSSSASSDSSETTRSIAERIVTGIYKHRNSWPFRKAVDRDEVPDYYEIISNPIDLTMIRDWVAKGRYDGTEKSGGNSSLSKGLTQLVQDLRTMFYNAELYNAADSDVWSIGKNLEEYVKNQFVHTDVTYHRDALDEG